MELFPGEHYLMSIIDIGNDEYVDASITNPLNKFVTPVVYRKCFMTTPRYSGFELGIPEMKGNDKFDIYSVAMLFSEIMMAEVGYGGVGLFNDYMTRLAREHGNWSFYSGKWQGLLYMLRGEDFKRYDDYEAFKAYMIDKLENNMIYGMAKTLWQKDHLRFIEAYQYIGNKDFFEEFAVFGQNEEKNQKPSNRIDNYENWPQDLEFDKFLYYNRSNIKYVMFMLMSYFWNFVFNEAYDEMVKTVYSKRSSPNLGQTNLGSDTNQTTDSLEKDKESPSDQNTSLIPVNKSDKKDQLDTIDEESIIGVNQTNDDELDKFLVETMKMKQSLRSYKQHMGMMLLKILATEDWTQRPTLAKLRDDVKAQYYSILSQSNTRKGIPEIPTDSTNPTDSTDSTGSDNSSGSDQSSLLSTQKVEDDTHDEHRIIDSKTKEFDLDLILGLRTTRKIVKVEDGKVDAKVKTSNDNYNYTVQDMVQRTSKEFGDMVDKLFHDMKNDKVSTDVDNVEIDLNLVEDPSKLKKEDRKKYKFLKSKFILKIINSFYSNN
jgi:hypothetical protein